MDLRATALQHEDRLRHVSVIVTDVDGVLTDGRIHWTGAGGFGRTFHTADGFGIKMMLRAGVPVAVVSADDNAAMRERVAMLGIPYAFYGTEDKRTAWLEIQRLTGAADAQILYAGDELFDVPLLRRAGFAVTVPDASAEVRAAAHYVTSRPGGHGALREVIDMVRYVRGIVPDVPDFA